MDKFPKLGKNKWEKLGLCGKDKKKIFSKIWLNFLFSNPKK